MSVNLFLDIETIPTQDVRIKNDIAEKLKPPANYKTEAAIQKWYATKEADAFDKEYRKTALIGTVGEVICISWALDDGNIHHVYRGAEGSEQVLLADFMLQLKDMVPVRKDGSLEECTWVGHYITGFDLRFLWQRYVMHGISPLINIPYKAKPWDKGVYDTKIEWSGMQSTGFGSLDALSKIMGYKSKGDITGATVWDAFQAGRYDDIAEYCDDDVERVRNIYKRMHFHG
jgi:3'-5' exonuclease